MAGGNISILLVEDELLIAALEKKQLESIGYTVHHVLTGENAVQSALDADTHYDLILMDINLGPGMDGTRAAERILEERDSPVLFLSSHTEPEVVEKTEIITSYGYVVKNSGIVVLDASIKMALRLFNEKLERTRAEEVLAEKAYLLSESQRIAHIGSYIWDIVTGNIRWSDECYRLYGVNPDTFAVTAESGITCIHPDDQSKSREWVRAHVDGEQTYPITYRTVWPDKSIHWLVTEGEVYRDADGNPVRMIGTIQDISEREFMERSLVESEEKFRKVFESSNVGKSLTAPGGKVNVNQALADMLGYSLGEMEDKTWQELTPPEDIGSVQALLDQLLQGKKDNTRFEKRYVAKNGSILWCDVSTVISRDNNGTPLFFITTVVDITERKRIETALRESEAALNKAQHVAHVGSWVWHIRENQLIWSDEMYRIFGITKDDFTGNLADFIAGAIHPDDRAAVEAVNFSLLREGKPAPVEYRVIHPDGMERRVRAEAGELIHDETGQPSILYGIVQDITERTRAEEKLRESEDRYRLLVNKSPYAIGVHQDGKVIFANPASLTLFGAHSMEDLIGKPFMELIHPDSQESVREGIGRMSAGKTGIVQSEGRFVRLDGTVVTVELTVTPFSHAGRPAIQIIAIDISGRKKIEEERQKFFMLAESSSEFIGMCDLDMQPIYVNPAGIRMVGLPDMAAACRVKVQDYFYREDQAFIANEFFPRVLREGHGDVEIRLRHFRTGEPIWFYYYLFSVHDASGKAIGWATVSHNISERRKAEEEIRRLNTELESRVIERTAQLEAANRELEAFSYSVSHDLRAPLRHINGYIELLNEQFNGNCPEKARHYLDTVAGASRQMGQLIDDLLQFSRTGRQEVRKEFIEMNILINELIEKMHPEIESRKITWNIQGLPKVYADYALLKQVWANLLDNGIKYTRNKKLTEITVGFREEEKDFVFFIHDNGVGFDMKYAHKLFGVFQRLHSQSEFEGTGIGLANVQRIINKHDGRVWAESKKDKGATFYFTLPKKKEHII